MEMFYFYDACNIISHDLLMVIYNVEMHFLQGCTTLLGCAKGSLTVVRYRG